MIYHYTTYGVAYKYLCDRQTQFVWHSVLHEAHCNHLVSAGHKVDMSASSNSSRFI